MSRNSTTKNEETYRNKNKKVFLIVDYLRGDIFKRSHLNRINKENFRKEFKGDRATSGKNLKEIGLILNVSLVLIPNIQIITIFLC